MSAAATAVARRRNAGATREGILEAARRRFACEGYDQASLREIAADAGVDAALVSRYFGGKDELFAAVLAASANPQELFHGAADEFAERIARMSVHEPQEDSKLDCLLIMLRSASSPRAAQANRRIGRAQFYGPLTEWLGGADAPVRARLLAGLMMGMAVSRAITPDLDLSAAERDRLEDRLRRVIREVIADD